jgi:hypothetical protein
MPEDAVLVERDAAFACGMVLDPGAAPAVHSRMRAALLIG